MTTANAVGDEDIGCTCPECYKENGFSVSCWDYYDDDDYDDDYDDDDYYFDGDGFVVVVVVD
jgi:hypothetical protein